MGLKADRHGCIQYCIALGRNQRLSAFTKIQVIIEISLYDHFARLFWDEHGNLMFNYKPKRHEILIEIRQYKLFDIILSSRLYRIIRVVNPYG